MLVTAAVALAVGFALPAWAHEDDNENTSAADLVRQAIALIVNAPDGTDAIADKIADAREAENTEGVDLALVERAGTAFADGDLHAARSLLERAIGAQPHMNEPEPPPIRETTPTTVAPPGSMGDMRDAPDEETVPPMTMATGAEPGDELIADSLDARPHLDGEDWALIAVSIIVGLLGVALGLRWRPRHGRPA